MYFTSSHFTFPGRKNLTSQLTSSANQGTVNLSSKRAEGHMSRAADTQAQPALDNSTGLGVMGSEQSTEDVFPPML